MQSHVAHSCWTTHSASLYHADVTGPVLSPDERVGGVQKLCVSCRNPLGKNGSAERVLGQVRPLLY